MGYIRHDTIVVTGSDFDDHKPVTDARSRALELGLQCTDIVVSYTNGYSSFMIVPDGSKEGWEASTAGDAARAEWIAWVRNIRSYIDWCHLSFGGDDYELVHVKDHNGSERNDSC